MNCGMFWPKDIYDKKYVEQIKPIEEMAENSARFALAMLNANLRMEDEDSYNRLCEITRVLLVSECARVDMKCVRVACFDIRFHFFARCAVPWT